MNEIEKKKLSEAITRNISIEPLLCKLDDNPEPSDWALLLTYYRLVHHSFNLIRDSKARISIVLKVDEFKKMMNEKLKDKADFCIHEGVPYLLYRGEKIELGYIDVLNILLTKDAPESIEKTLDSIYRKHKGEVYNTKYYPITDEKEAEL